MNTRASIRLFKYICFLLVYCSCVSTPAEEEEIECHRCTYGAVPEEICNGALLYEICVLGPHESSFQVVLEITETCDGQSVVSQEIGFLEDVLAIHVNDGAACVKL